MLHFLAISGSLRAASANAALLRAAAQLAPANISVRLYEGLGNLPHFNLDRENEIIPAVIDFRVQLRAADAVIISSPEYAHGVPGVMKNALDWVVGSDEFSDKPVALLDVSARSGFARASLQETLKTMGARIVPEASLILPLTTNKIAQETILQDAELAKLVRTALSALAGAIPQTKEV